MLLTSLNVRTWQVVFIEVSAAKCMAQIETEGLFPLNDPRFLFLQKILTTDGQPRVSPKLGGLFLSVLNNTEFDYCYHYY